MYPSPRARPDYRTPTVWSARAAIATDRTRLFPNCGRFRNSDLRKLRGQLVVSRGESWEVSTHLDVSEVSRLGLVGGTTGRAGADARPENEADGAVASPESRRRAASALIESHDGVFRRTARRYSIASGFSGLPGHSASMTARNEIPSSRSHPRAPSPPTRSHGGSAWSAAGRLSRR